MAATQDLTADIAGRERRSVFIVGGAFRETFSPERLHAVFDRLLGGSADLGDSARWIELPGAGRGTIVRLEIQGEAFYVRRFLRGGMMAMLSNAHFGKLPGNRTTRPVHEFEILRRLDGLSVPTPAAAYTRESALGFLYQGFIVTKAIPHTGNFLTAVQESREPNRVEFTRVARDAGRVAQRILLGGVMHEDLHLGNVVFQADARAWIVDFDKAWFIQKPGETGRLRERLLDRWVRSVRRHDLPDGLIEAFSQGLRDPNL